ncbi:hypothetical protein G9A89_011855 [Geosiphon pyriformis]|nr:hypothetical protein G9A89_011855 [Geosiphon pyriformis]
MTESENIRTNHLRFAKSLFQQYSQQLKLNNNHFPAEFVFNFYVNDKITDCLGETVNIESTRENFYTELFQHISLPRNYSFAPIIREINQTIERYTQQQFPITYADKGKGRLQTPAVMPKQIQPLTWKKTQVESPTNLSYHYILKTNTFTTIKQGENEAVTIYLGCFHKNLCQIQAIQNDYFIAPQILNQFIRGLCSSILQRICSIHPADLQAVVTNARDFETAKLKANYVQAINLVMNGSSELNFKLKQFNTRNPQNKNAQHYLSLLVTPEDALPNNQELNQHKPLTNNISSTTITYNESLDTIFPFEFKETTPVLLFSETTLDTKLITAMYTDTKIDGHAIKLILNSRSAGSIITRQLMDQLGH